MASFLKFSLVEKKSTTVYEVKPRETETERLLTVVNGLSLEWSFVPWRSAEGNNVEHLQLDPDLVAYVRGLVGPQSPSAPTPTKLCIAVQSASRNGVRNILDVNEEVAVKEAKFVFAKPLKMQLKIRKDDFDPATWLRAKFEREAKQGAGARDLGCRLFDMAEASGDTKLPCSDGVVLADAFVLARQCSYFKNALRDKRKRAADGEKEKAGDEETRNYPVSTVRLLLRFIYRSDWGESELAAQTTMELLAFLKLCTTVDPPHKELMFTAIELLLLERELTDEEAVSVLTALTAVSVEPGCEFTLLRNILITRMGATPFHFLSEDDLGDELRAKIQENVEGRIRACDGCPEN